MTTLTSFLANRIEAFSIEGLCKFWLCTLVDWSSCEITMLTGFLWTCNVLLLLTSCEDACCLQDLTSVRYGTHPHSWGRQLSVVQDRGSQSGWERSTGDRNTNHRDSLPTVADSIQYSWKCDTFPLQWMALTLKPVLSTSTSCSFQRVIEFLKKSQGRAQLLQSEAEQQQKHRLILSPFHAWCYEA